MSDQTKWLQCYMKQINYIKYTTYELYPEYYTLNIDKFMEYINFLLKGMMPINYQDFQKDLQSFLPLILDIESRQWERLEDGETGGRMSYTVNTGNNSQAGDPHYHVLDLTTLEGRVTDTEAFESRIADLEAAILLKAESTDVINRVKD